MKTNYGLDKISNAPGIDAATCNFTGNTTMLPCKPEVRPCGVVSFHLRTNKPSKSGWK